MATPTGDGGAAPWVPDEATLTRLANEFFAALPGQPATVPPAATEFQGQQPAIVPPGYQPAVVSAGQRPARPGRLGRSFVLPGGGQPDAPSFYFVDELASVLPADARPPFNVEAVRREFPILGERVNGRQLVWLDNAATTQKPQAVIDRLSHFYSRENSNVHRGAHARGLPRRAVG